MRVAFYGGSFNPPHFSHFLAATWALCTGEVDEVWMVPCYSHAFSKKLLPFEHRVAMCQIGADQIGPKIRVCTIEEELSSVSYTIDTIKALQKKHPSYHFRLLVGMDILHEKDAWRSFDELIQLAPLLVLGRGGVTPLWEDDLAQTIELPEISSTEIRNHLENNQDISHLVPKPIVEYIRQHQLYQT